jgi:hypothetical protein
VLELRVDLRSGQLPLHVFAADLNGVLMCSGKRPTYEDPEKFFAPTFPTHNLRRPVRDVVLRVAGRNDKAVRQLELTYGGGNTHTLITPLHLARNPETMGAGWPPDWHKDPADASCDRAELRRWHGDEEGALRDLGRAIDLFDDLVGRGFEHAAAGLVKSLLRGLRLLQARQGTSVADSEWAVRADALCRERLLGLDLAGLPDGLRQDAVALRDLLQGMGRCR